jgi:hypothetical protein
VEKVCQDRHVRRVFLGNVIKVPLQAICGHIGGKMFQSAHREKLRMHLSRLMRFIRSARWKRKLIAQMNPVGSRAFVTGGILLFL